MDTDGAGAEPVRTVRPVRCFVTPLFSVHTDGEQVRTYAIFRRVRTTMYRR